MIATTSYFVGKYCEWQNLSSEGSTVVVVWFDCCSIMSSLKVLPGYKYILITPLQLHSGVVLLSPAMEGITFYPSQIQDSSSEVAGEEWAWKALFNFLDIWQLLSKT